MATVPHYLSSGRVQSIENQARRVFLTTLEIHVWL